MNLKKIKKTMLCAGLLMMTTACSNGSDTDKSIIVGSKDFTEGLIVSEIYALGLEDAGFQVERKFDIAGSLVHTSLVNKEIDVYPEYTGTGLMSVLGMDMLTDPQEVYDTVKKEYQEQYQITWLNYSSANDGQGLAIRTEVAKELGIKTITDLQKHASELRFASQGEFDEREDSLPALEKAYGKFEWKDSRVYDGGLKYQLLAQGEADVTPAYTTDGALADQETYTMLIDDKKVWSPYNLAPVIRTEVLDQYPEITDILNNISASLTTEKLIELNAKVDLEQQEYEDVAKEYYESIK